MAEQSYPAGSPVLLRRWTYAAPPWRLFEALAGEHEGWLHPEEAERTPRVVEAVLHERVVLAPWVDADVDKAEVVIENNGYGTRLRIVLHGAREPADERRKDIRYRLGVLFGERLRHWVDGW